MCWLQGRHGLEDAPHPTSLILWQPLTLHQALGASVSHVLQPASGGSDFSFSWLRIMSPGFEFLLCYLIAVWLLTGEGNGYHSSILAWRIPWTEEPSDLQSMGLQRVRHDCFHALPCSLNLWSGEIYGFVVSIKYSGIYEKNFVSCMALSTM